MDEIAKTPFKVEDNDLYEFYIFKMPNEKCAMMLKMHHLIADAWTFGLSSNEVMDTYYNLEHNLPLKDYNEFSYIDFINSEKEYVSSAKMLKDKEYWLVMHKEKYLKWRKVKLRQFQNIASKINVLYLTFLWLFMVFTLEKYAI